MLDLASCTLRRTLLDRRSLTVLRLLDTAAAFGPRRLARLRPLLLEFAACTLRRTLLDCGDLPALRPLLLLLSP